MHRVPLLILTIAVTVDPHPLRPASIKADSIHTDLVPGNQFRNARDVIKGCFCPPGFQPRINCTAHRDAVCEVCPRNFYSESPGIKPCQPCLPCSGNTHMVAPCTPTRQTICIDIIKLTVACEELMPVFHQSENDGIQNDVMEEEYHRRGPGNGELGIILLSVITVGVIIVLIYVMNERQTMTDTSSSRAVENADFFNKAGSIFQTNKYQPKKSANRTSKRSLATKICSLLDMIPNGPNDDQRLDMDPPPEPPRMTKIWKRNPSREEYWPPPTKHNNKSNLDADGYYRGTFDSEGGTLGEGNVAVTICKLSIPKGKVFTIRAKTHTNFQEWVPYIDPSEVIIAPPLELHVEGGHVFDDHVTLCIPSCIKDPNELAAVRVFSGDRATGKNFNPIPRMEEKQSDSEAFYKADEECIYVHAKHFESPQFVCTISGNQINLQLQMLVFYEHRILAEHQYLKIKVNLCDSRSNIPVLREAYFEKENLPLVESCSWQQLQLPLGYATPYTDVNIELIPDDDWEETFYGDMKMPLKLNQKLRDVLNLQSNRLAEFNFKRQLVGKPANTYQGTLILGSSEMIKEDTKREVVKMTPGGLTRRDYTRSRGTTNTCTIETMHSKNEIPVIIHLDENMTSPSRVLHGNIEDGIAFITHNLASMNFHQFYRQLGLKEPDIDSIRERHPHDFREQKMQMLRTWHQKLGKMANNQALKTALQEIGLFKMAEDFEMDILHKIK